MKKVLLVVCVVALIAVASAAYATDSSWLIGIKALNPTSSGGGGSAFVGVGTSTDTAGSTNWPSADTSTANAEGGSTLNGDSTSTFHARHDVLRDTVGVEEYAWDLKIGARTNYAPTDVRIALYNNMTASLGVGGALNSSLAYAFYDGEGSLLCWFSSASLKAQFLNDGKHDELLDGVSTRTSTGQIWNDVSVLQKTSSAWSPTTSNWGFYVTDSVLKGNGYTDLTSYHFEAFGYTEPPPVEPTPEPGSLMALGSGLVGLAGFAIRRRK